MFSYINSSNFDAQLRHNNISLDAFLGGRTSGHASQMRSDRAYNGAFDIDDDIFANERFFIESEAF